MMSRKIYSATTKRYKQASSSKKPAEKDDNLENIMQSANPKPEKLFFQLDYLFSQPTPTAKHPRKHLISPRHNRDTISASEYSVRVAKSELAERDNKQSNHNNTAFFNLSSIGHSQNTKCKQVQLNFTQNNFGQQIHHRRFVSNLHPFSQKSHVKQPNPIVDLESQTIEDCLTTRGFANQPQKSWKNEKMNSQKSRKRLKRSEIKVHSLWGIEQLMQTRRKNWLQSQQFKKYYSKQVRFAKRAFIDKNKQMFKIYRPWTPTQFQFDQTEYAHS